MVCIVMADLNEVYKFEQELRVRMGLDTSQPDSSRIITHMAVREHRQPYKNWENTDDTFMAIEEHGQPYKTQDSKMITRMVIEEHGQPYKKR